MSIIADAPASLRVGISALWISVPDLAREWSPMAGWLSEPDLPGEFGVVVLPPVSYAYSSSHRFWRSLTEALVNHGITALRIDYPGTGDSAGVAARLANLTPWRSALRCAIGVLNERGITKVVLVGGQLGAMLALLDAEGAAPAGIVTVAPVVSGRRFVRSLKMIGDAAPEDVGGLAFGGYYFSAGLLDDIGALNIAALADIPQLTLAQDDASVAAFMERAAEEATVDPQLVTTVADWIAALAPSESPGRQLDTGVARNGRTRTATTSMLHEDEVIHEQFVSVGPDHLVGLLTSPTEVDDVPDDVYVLVNSGSDPHIGPGRAWVELARYLARRGRATIRIDLRSWGESPDGPNVPGRPGDAHAVDDIMRMVAALNDGLRRRVVLGGLCAGAWSSLEAARDVDVAGLVVLNPQLYWQPGDPTEPLIADTRARRMPEIIQIKEDGARGRWDEEDRRGLRPRAGEWLDCLVSLGRKTSMVFAEGDDGLEYLQDRLARRVRVVTESGLIRVVELLNVDHSMGRTWQRPIVFDAIAAELDWVLGPATNSCAVNLHL